MKRNKKKSGKLRKLLVLATLMLLSIVWGPQRVSADVIYKPKLASHMGDYRSGSYSMTKAYSGVDWTGDAKRDTIRFTTSFNGEQVAKVFVSVNGKSVLNVKPTHAYGVGGVEYDYIHLGKKVNILRVAALDSEHLYEHVWERYYFFGQKRKVFVEALNIIPFGGDLYRIKTVSSKGIVVTCSRMLYETGWTHYDLQFVYKKGKLKPKSFTGNAWGPQSKYKAKKSLVLTKKPGGRAVAIRVSKNQVLTLKKAKVDAKQGIWLQFAYGKKAGWLKCSSNYNQAKDTFYNVEIAG